MTPRAAFWVVWVSFAYLLAGVNLINPLLPWLRGTLGISAGAVAALYGTYLIALVPMLLTLPRRLARYGARQRLAAAVLLMVIADLLHVQGSVSAMGAGRVFMAGAVALGTGAAAEIAVRVAGERGRTATATANTGGALLGTIAGGSALLLAAQPVALVFSIHAMVGLGLGVVVWRMHPTEVAAPVRTHGTVATPTGDGRIDGVLLGGFAFASAGVVIVLGPTLFQGAGSSLGARVALVPLVLFIGAATAQRLARPSRVSIAGFGLLVVVGMTMMIAAVTSHAFALLVVSAAVTGVGFGAVFMVGLAWTTHGAAHARQGSLASAYACTAYAFAGVVIIGGGIAADLTSAATALVTILVTMSTVLCVWLGLAFRQPDPFSH